MEALSTPESIPLQALGIEETEEKSKIPDGGWGWVVVFSSAMLCLIMDGISFSFGILFVEFIKEFEASRSASSWIGSLFISVPLITGPIMSYLVDKYGCRSMTIVGGVASASGFILSSYAKNVTVMNLTFGVISGLGLGLTFVTAVVSIAFWFEKKRNLAVGLGACGVGIGTFVYAPLTTFLLGEFGWRWTLMLLAGTLLNMCVCGALMRDPDWLIVENRDKKLKRKQKVQEPKMDLEEIKKLLEAETPQLDEKTDVFHSSLLNLPTYLQQQENLPDEVVKQLKENKQLYKFVQENYPRVLINHNLKGFGSVEGVTDASNNNARQWKKSDYKISRRRSSTTSRKFARQSLKHINTSSYKLNKATSLPNILNTSDESLDNVEGKKRGYFRAILIEIKAYISLFWELHFLLMQISTIIFFAWFMTPYFYLADHMNLLGYTPEQASYTMAFLGVTNTIGMVALGWAGDQSWCSVPKTFGISLILCGISCSAIVVFSFNYYLLTFCAALFGLFMASSYSFTPIILVELLPLDYFTKSYGLTLLCQGIGHLIGPPIAGWIYDLTKSWDLSFHVSGVWMILSGLFILAIPYTKNRNIITGGPVLKELVEEKSDGKVKVPVHH